MKVEISPDFSVGKYHWNHRVVRQKDGSLAIHEAHYHIAGASSGDCSITSEPVDVYGENIDELRHTLKRMMNCLDKPILDYETCKEECTA